MKNNRNHNRLIDLAVTQKTVTITGDVKGKTKDIIILILINKHMKKIIVAIIGLIAMANPAVAQKTVTISGVVEGNTQGYNKVYIYGGIKDSTEIKDGKFQFTLPFTKVANIYMYDEYSVKVKHSYAIFLILVTQPGMIVLKNIDITKGVSSGKITGIPTAVDFQEFRTEIAEKNKEIMEIHSKKYAPGFYNPKNPQHANYLKDNDSLNKEKMPGVYKAFIKSHPDSYVSVYVLAGTGLNELPTKDLQADYNLLSKSLQQSPEGKSVSAYLSGQKSAAIGSFVKDFTLNSPEDKPFNFNQLKGKYVVVDFWASWCGPCKQSFPHMKEIYKKYKSDRFEIFSISIDKDKSAWLKELKAQNLPWLQALDTKNIALSGFAVNAVPTTYLIGPDGKIIMKEIGFSSDGNSPLEKKIIELFGERAVK